jgi:hypothetical protein
LSSPNGNIAQTGNGFWNLSASLNMVRTYDPIVVFGGLGYRHDFPEDFFGREIQPGESFTFNYGIAFAISDDTSLTAQFNAIAQSETRVDGITIPNSNTEAMSLRLALIRRTSKRARIQPFVTFGLTDDATDVLIGMIFTQDIPSCCGVPSK